MEAKTSCQRSSKKETTKKINLTISDLGLEISIAGVECISHCADGNVCPISINTTTAPVLSCDLYTLYTINVEKRKQGFQPEIDKRSHPLRLKGASYTLSLVPPQNLIISLIQNRMQNFRDDNVLLNLMVRMYAV